MTQQNPKVAAVEALDAEIANEQAHDRRARADAVIAAELETPGMAAALATIEEMEDEDSNPTGERCGATARLSGPCDRGAGHPGEHRDDAGNEWPTGGES